MEKQPIKPKITFSAAQNVLAGIALSFYVIYKFYLSDVKIIKDLGPSYPWFIQIWVMIMVSSGGLSGYSFVIMVIKYLPAVAKAIGAFKKDVQE